MPTYTYRCSACNYKFDLFHSIKENGTRNCPKCGAEVYRMIGSGAGLIFKGSGFYVTDYKNGKNSGNGTSKHPHKVNDNTHHSSVQKDNNTEEDNKNKKSSEKSEKSAAKAS